MSTDANDTLAAITVGAHVTILVPNGIGRDGIEWKERTGRAVMRGAHGWILNMGGAHGTPAVATADNVVRVRIPHERRQERRQ